MSAILPAHLGQQVKTIFQDTNFDQETTVRVVDDGSFVLKIELYDGTEVNPSRLVGKQAFCISAQRECFERARRIVAGKLLPGELSPVFVPSAPAQPRDYLMPGV